MLTLGTLAVMFAAAVVYFREGVFNAAATLFGIVVAGIVAFGFFEPLANELESTFNDFAPGYEDAFALAGLFAVTLGLIRAGAYALLKDEPSIWVRVTQAGGGLLGLANGYLAAGFLVCVLQTLPWHEKFLGFEPRTEGAKLEQNDRDRRAIAEIRQLLGDARRADEKRQKAEAANKTDDAAREAGEAARKQEDAQKKADTLFKRLGQGDPKVSLERRLEQAEKVATDPDPTPLSRWMPPDQAWLKLMTHLANGGLAGGYGDGETWKDGAAKRRSDMLGFEARYTVQRRWTETREPASGPVRPATPAQPANPGTGGPGPAPGTGGPGPAPKANDDTTIKRGY